jgi:hypothetical protein
LLSVRQIGTVAATALSSELQHDFELEVLRREVKACSNLASLRELTLKALDLLELQRRFFRSELMAAPAFSCRRCGGGL